MRKTKDTKGLLGLLLVICLLLIGSFFFVRSVIAGGYELPASGVITDATPPIVIVIRNTSGEEMSKGDVVVWQTDTALSATTYIGGLQLGVDVSTTTAQAQTTVAGVIVDDTVADAAYGRMAIAGVCDVNVNYSNTAVGDILVTTTTLKGSATADHCSGTVIAANLGDEGGFAVVLEVITDSTTAKCQLRIQ